MIFSQWRPEGGFDYYESDVTHAIGDDLPEVQMPAPSGGIGVPAQDVGYPLPPGAEFIGTGDQPKGIMTPMLRRKGGKGLSGTKTSLTSQETLVVLFIIGVFGAAAWASRHEKGYR